MPTSRTRTSGSIFPTKWEWTHAYSNGNPQVVGSTAGNGQGLMSAMHDVVVPNFKQRLKNGEIIMNGMTLTKYERTYSPGRVTEGPVSGPHWLLGPAGSTCTHTGDMLGFIEGPAQQGLTGDISVGTESSRMRDRVLIDAYAKMNTADIAGLFFMKELDQTLQMLRRPLQSTIKHLNHAHSVMAKMLRTRKFVVPRSLRSASLTTQAAGAAWLEVRYGMKPLMLDCESAIEIVEKQRSAIGEQILVARGGESREFTLTSPFSNLPTMTSWTANGVLKRHRRLGAFAGVIYRRNLTDEAYLRQTLGTRPSDLPSSLLEIIPYSFVAEWFVNIGSWIKAVTPNPTVSVVSSWVTTISEVRDEFSAELKVTRDYPNNQSFSGSGGTSMKRYVDVVRVPNPPLPSLPVREKTISRLHTIDGLALLLQRISSGLGRLRH